MGILAERRVASARIVPALDELEDDLAGLRLGAELPPVEQLAFERGEEALAHRIVVRITDRPHRLTHTGLLASEPEGDRGICNP